VLLAASGSAAEDLEGIFVAGAFGSRLNVQHAMDTGLLPCLPAKNYILAGNAALVGAAMMLTSGEMRQKAESIARSTSLCDLTSTPDFEEAFVDNLYFPGN
jgi:uncharacterized 2Fe-2S/4Fe-4S cluster protein (DUF4445 family)